MTTHTQPTIAGMGAYEGCNTQSGILAIQITLKKAAFALQALSDDALVIALTDELRSRDAMVASRVIDGVTK
jgi:hypothetical protein